jgi:hypothetical protein
VGGGHFLVKPFEVREPERFELVQGHDNLIEDMD